jgi:two-component system response regulator NreC
MRISLPGGKENPALSEQSDQVIYLALLDDQTMFREGLRALIEQEDDLEVIAQATNLSALEELDVVPHVVITDLLLPDVERDEIVSRLRSRFNNAAIIALTSLDDLATVQQVLAAGADGYVLKSAATEDLFAGIRTVARGGLYLQPSIGIAFASRPPEDLAQPAVGALTPKETDVLRLLALGHTNAEIAQLLGASLRTIETHRAHIHQKLDRHSRAQLVRFALDAGLLRLDDQGAPAPDRRVVNREPDTVHG